MSYNVSKFRVCAFSCHRRVVHDPNLRQVPPETLKLKELRGEIGKTDCKLGEPISFTNRFITQHFTAVNFSEYDHEPSGNVALIGRIKFV